MKSLTIKIENCYGIRQLDYTFNFENAKEYSVYAPNGFMKTSFSKTFLDLSKDKESGDRVFPDRKTIRQVIDESGADIKSEKVFVVEPYNQDFSSDKTSLLLVNQSIKKQYDEALLKIEEKKETLFKKLKQLSGLTGKNITPETEMLKIFNKSTIYDVMEEIKEIAQNNSSGEALSTLSYSELFNEKTIVFLDSGQMRHELKDYIDKYNELVEKSPVLSKTFNHYHAKTIQKNLLENGFFTANHSVRLFNGNEKEEINSAEQFNHRIEEEKKKIFTDGELSKKFDAIDKKLTNSELRRFRDYLFENQDVVVRLSDYKKLQKDIWLAYLANHWDFFLDLMKEYENGKEVIKKAIIAAKKEKTEWMEVVDLFNKRFSVPFKMVVSNQEDVILKGSSPQLSFTFNELGLSKPIDKSALLSVLSQGEKRALYILNILFELNARKKRGTKTLLIVDDIADSFDYKNKYAIVEYLKDLSESSDFYSIYLTHNFDFHRTISGRLNIPRGNRLSAVKNGGILNLAEEKYQKNPFEYWKNNFENQRFIISSIPFVRNLAEYCGYDAEFFMLTSLLHQKTDTKNILIKDLEQIYRSILKDKSNLVLPDHDRRVIDILFELSDMILGEIDATAELESKIILSVAIRLQAEEFMIKKIADQHFVDTIRKNQTSCLIKRFRSDFPDDANSIRLLEQVNLMTPENIHLNSFMYEPILDMASEHLKNLYQEVKSLNMQQAQYPIN